MAAVPSGDSLISNLPTAAALNSTEFIPMDQTINTVNGPTTTTVKISSPTLASQLFNIVLPNQTSGPALLYSPDTNVAPVFETLNFVMTTWFNALPTSLPATSGVLWNNGGTLAQS